MPEALRHPHSWRECKRSYRVRTSLVGVPVKRSRRRIRWSLHPKRLSLQRAKSIEVAGRPPRANGFDHQAATHLSNGHFAALQPELLRDANRLAATVAEELCGVN